MRDYHALFLSFVERHDAIEPIMIRKSFDVEYMTGIDEFRSVVAAVDRSRQLAVVSDAHGDAVRKPFD
jgi:hypothetical protein